MRLATLAGLYVAVVLSAQVGANKIIRLPFTHLEAPGGVYSIGVALALVQLAHHTGATRRDGAINAQLLIGLGFAGHGRAEPRVENAVWFATLLLSLTRLSDARTPRSPSTAIRLVSIGLQ